MSWMQENRIELLILALLGAVFNISIYLQMQGPYISFLDTDDYMRLVRIRDFFKHYDFNDNIIKRCNVPHGCSLHWTRFYDFFLIVPSYILSFFTNSTEKSIEYVGFFISPIIKTITIMFFFKLAKCLMGTKNAFLAAAIFAANPIIAQFGTFGRPDHHALIMLFIIVFFNYVFLFIKSGLGQCYEKLAIISSICIWISPETLIPILLVDVVLFLYAAFFLKNLRSEILLNLYRKNLLIAFFICAIIISSIKSGICILMSIAVAAMLMRCFFIKHKNKYFCIICLLFQPFLKDISPVHYDEISVVHFTLYLYSATLFGISSYLCECHKADRKFFSNPNEPIIISTKISAIALGIAFLFLHTYPRFLYGMEADIPIFVKKIWLYKIAEMQSPFKHGDFLFLILHVVTTAVAIVGKLKEIICISPSRIKNKADCKKDHQLRSNLLFWLILIFVTSFYLVFASMAYRMVPYSTAFGLILIVEFGMNNKLLESLNRLVRIVIAFFMSTLFVFFTAYIDKSNTTDESNKQTKYSTKEMLCELDKVSDTPVVIMAHSNNGPAILYYTKHSVIGAPYHRQINGIIASYRVMEDEFSDEVVRDILISTNTSYVFIKKSDYRKINEKNNHKMSLPEMIINNKYPIWITPVKLHKKFDDIIVAKVDKKLIRAKK
jgi:asparagine N-glycosylation enzyme membrane subunit Stt3